MSANLREELRLVLDETKAGEHPSQAKFIAAVNAVVNNPTNDSPKQFERALMDIAGDLSLMSLPQLDQLQQTVREKQAALISPGGRLGSMSQIRGHALKWLSDMSRSVASAQERASRKNENVARQPKEDVIAGLRSIVADRRARQINGVTVDPFSAELALRVHESLSSANQAKMAGLSIKKLMTIAHQMGA